MPAIGPGTTRTSGTLKDLLVSIPYFLLSGLIPPLAVVNSVQEYWGGSVRGYRTAETVLFDGQVATGCGTASSATT